MTVQPFAKSLLECYFFRGRRNIWRCWKVLVAPLNVHVVVTCVAATI